MRTAGYRVALLFAAVFATAIGLLTAGSPSTQQQAITATVSSGDQGVGVSRDMIQREAIVYNLAGSARNIPGETVEVALQGDKDRIDQVLAAIRAGSNKWSNDNTISQAPAAVDPNLKTFTVFGWTSTSLNITNPYNLVFPLRAANNLISPREARTVWNKILEGALQGDDLNKFMNSLDDDD